MANREENLKKINDDLEMLSDEELDQVAGGTLSETAHDSDLLYDYGLMDRWYGIIPLTFYWKSKSAEVDEAWAKAGVTCCTKYAAGNQYWHGGKEISRKEAIEIVKSKFKRIHTVSDE